MPAPKTPATPAATEAPPEGERIAKVLSRAGIASRREAERMIALGQVTVNGRVIDSPALNVRPTDRITVAGQPVAAPEEARLWLYYKPEGLVTSTADENGRETVFDHLPADLPRVMTVGRLDLNSEGLLLLTNDGELKRRLELPSTGWLRKYRVRVKGNPTDPDLEPLRAGITVEGERFQPMTVSLDRVQGANAWLTVGLREGKNREIRRAMTAIGLTVNRLIRLSYGPFRLNDMEPGQVEEVKARVLRDQLGLAAVADDTGTAAAKPRVVRKRAAPERATDAPAGRGAGKAPVTRPDRPSRSGATELSATGAARKAGKPPHRVASAGRDGDEGRVRPASARSSQDPARRTDLPGKRTTADRGPRDAAPGRTDQAPPRKALPEGAAGTRRGPGGARQAQAKAGPAPASAAPAKTAARTGRPAAKPAAPGKGAAPTARGAGAGTGKPPTRRTDTGPRPAPKGKPPSRPKG